MRTYISISDFSTSLLTCLVEVLAFLFRCHAAMHEKKFCNCLALAGNWDDSYQKHDVLNVIL